MTKGSIRKPEWLRVSRPGGDKVHDLKQRLRNLNLFTVCEEAKCPNMGECWSQGTATLMILGDVCTRGCRFCAVRSGNPRGLLDPQEPQKCAETVMAMNLTYVVITCVDRDDLPDGGAQQFARVIVAVRHKKPDCLVEVLTSDYCGQHSSIERILAAKPEVFAHNLETVERLTNSVRDPRASYAQSLRVLEMVKEIQPEQITKSSLMLGLGESTQELHATMADLRSVSVDVLTLGQYLQPTANHLKVVRYVPPEEFDALAEAARAMGFLYVAAGPLVRSSYKAGEYFLSNFVRKQPFRGTLVV